eukprot:scaffold1032_cov223-Pinguiococcus_pyrenoidosus.AAC.4
MNRSENMLVAPTVIRENLQVAWRVRNLRASLSQTYGARVAPHLSGRHHGRRSAHRVPHGAYERRGRRSPEVFAADSEWRAGAACRPGSRARGRIHRGREGQASQSGEPLDFAACKGDVAPVADASSRVVRGICRGGVLADQGAGLLGRLHRPVLGLAHEHAQQRHLSGGGGHDTTAAISGRVGGAL